jgi:hypothetical protein
MYTNGGTIIANSSNVRVRLVSAKPIRQAIARIMELNPSKYRPEEIAKAQRFAEFKYDRTIVVGLRSETRNTGLAANDFYPGWMSPAFLRNYYRNVYLEIKGKRIPVQDFQAPGQDGLGVKLIFPRFIDNRPIIDPIAGEVCFHAELSKLIINARFSIAELFYNGVQEY